MRGDLQFVQSSHIKAVKRSSTNKMDLVTVQFGDVI